jgi:hypothetical protein
MKRPDPPLSQIILHSLQACLRALLGDPGEVSPALDVALGAPFAPCHPTGEPATDGHAWDAGLVAAAALYGFALRPMHPRRAARRLSTAGEFDDHFHDSYAPLIERALAHDQCVLAWQGWAESAGRCWGIIERHDDTTGRFAGRAGPTVTAAELTGPAIQCYTVEERTARSPTPDETLATGLAAGARVVAELADDPAWHAATDLWDHWQERIAGGPLDTRIAADWGMSAAYWAADRAAVADWINANRFTTEAETANAIARSLAESAAALDTLAQALDRGDRNAADTQLARLIAVERQLQAAGDAVQLSK